MAVPSAACFADIFPNLTEAFESFANAAGYCSDEKEQLNFSSAAAFADLLADDSWSDFLDEELPTTTRGSGGSCRGSAPPTKPSPTLPKCIGDLDDESSFLYSDSESTFHLDLGSACQADAEFSTLTSVIQSSAVHGSSRKRDRFDRVRPLPLGKVVGEVRATSGSRMRQQRAESSSVSDVQSAEDDTPAPSGPRICRIDSCTSDVSGETAYYKRRRVCRKCVRATSVVVNHVEVRFCQQCSQLHPVNEFDGIKRSCRAKLAMHRKRSSQAPTSANCKQRNKRQRR